MQNNVWFFGDCFTWGFGCYPGDPYYNYSPVKSSIWTEIVASSLKKKHIKPYYSFGATPYIISNLINNLPNIKKGDTIIISDSEPKSLLTLARNRRSIKCLNAFDILDESFEKWNSEEEKIAVTSFVKNQIAPHEKIWEDFYVGLINKLGGELKNRDVDVLFWSHSLWKTQVKFESITEATGGKIIDPHWSWNGHREFANYILNRIDKKEFIGTCLI